MGRSACRRMESTELQDGPSQGAMLESVPKLWTRVAHTDTWGFGESDHLWPLCGREERCGPVVLILAVPPCSAPQVGGQVKCLIQSVRINEYFRV